MPATPTARGWTEEHLACHPAGPGAAARWLCPADLTPARLAGLHAQSVARGATGAAAAKWLCSWFAGGVATAVGLTLALPRAGVLGPDPRWRLHPGGWPDRVALDVAGLAVAPGHPWVGQPGVVVLRTHEEVRRAALEAVLGVAGPVVAGCARLAGVGRAALWAEVGDALGLAVVRRAGVPVEPAAVRELAAVVRLAGAPWAAVPTLEVAAGPSYRAVKAGCCLAWRCAPPGGTAPDRCATCPVTRSAGRV